MECSACGFDNPNRVKFCGECGVQLTSTCAQCGADAPLNFKFCGECGAPLDEPQPVLADQLKATAEHRQLTGLFCDLAESAALSERLDPEDLRAVVREYQAACVDIIERYGGYTAQYLGDGILDYFGFPRAHEDDPLRAVHTGLGGAKTILDGPPNRDTRR